MEKWDFKYFIKLNKIFENAINFLSSGSDILTGKIWIFRRILLFHTLFSAGKRMLIGVRNP